MIGAEPKTVGEDGLFKMLTWRSPVITRLFGLPDIVAEPHHQEFAHPIVRRIDALFELADGSLLNVEHQSSLKDRDALARRLIEYRCMIRERFPLPRILHQVVVFTGTKPKDRRRIGNIAYDDVDKVGGGIRFRVAVKDFLIVPPDFFRQSGDVEDRILGVLAAGASDRAYMAEVKRIVAALAGEAGKVARAKFYAACVIRGDEPVIQEMIGDLDMWIDDVKDNPVAKRFVEIASRERVEAAKREGMIKGVAEFLVRHAVEHKIALPGTAEETVDIVAAGADKEALYAMFEDITHMTDHADMASFLKRHGVDVADRRA